VLKAELALFIQKMCVRFFEALLNTAVASGFRLFVCIFARRRRRAQGGTTILICIVSLETRKN